MSHVSAVHAGVCQVTVRMMPLWLCMLPLECDSRAHVCCMLTSNGTLCLSFDSCSYDVKRVMPKQEAGQTLELDLGQQQPWDTPQDFKM